MSSTQRKTVGLVYPLCAKNVREHIQEIGTEIALIDQLILLQTLYLGMMRWNYS